MMKKVSRRLCAAALLAAVMLGGCRRIDEELPETAVTAASGGFAETGAETREKKLGDYIYSKLTEDEKKNYDIIRTAVENFEDAAVFEEKIEPNELRKLYVSVYNTCFEDLWLSSIFYRPDEADNTLTLSYRYEKDEALRLKAELEKKTEEIMAGLPENASDYTKCLYFHDHLVLNCDFSADTAYCNTPYGALVDGKAQCEGYAFAYNYLCSKAGVDCISVWGTNSENASHAWNIVNIDGECYHVDCTWDDPVLTEQTPNFLRHYYFLVKDSDILGTTHFLDGRYFEWPSCLDGSNFYKREGLYCTDTAECTAMMENAAAKAFETGAYSFGIRCGDEKTFKAVCDTLLMPINARLYIANAMKRAGIEGTAGKVMSYTNDSEYVIHVSVNIE
ncbi:MAG: hypothetical protein J6F31_08130 [Oscillospiraceae bacterium]|nr:hypothetical protein [Oscillospiraceae bacterium]